MGIGYFLQFGFAQHALEAAFLVAVSCGLIGPFVITRTMSFAVHGTSELAFTGAVAAVELFALAYFELHLVWRADDLNYRIAFHLTRSAVLLAAGLFAGSVGVTIKSYFERALAAGRRER